MPTAIAARIRTRGVHDFFGASLAIAGALAYLGVGWHAVSSTAQPELLAHTWLQWHYDVFIVPPSLTAIATNDVGSQAMVGKRLFATQFHPEATTEIITRWSQGAGTQELHKLGIDPKHLCEVSTERVANIAPFTARLVDWFLSSMSTE